MLKLYEIYTNDGDWGGCHSDYIIAENEEEAKEKSDWYQRHKNDKHVDCYCWEKTGDDILRNLLSYKYDNKYTMTIEIKERDE